MNAKELDEARWAEACRRVPALGEALTPSRKRTRIYRELVIEGWEPPKDELAEAIQAVWCYALGCEHVPVERAENLRTELAARGLTIGKAVRMTRPELIKAWKHAKPGDFFNTFSNGFLLAGGVIEETGDAG